MLDANVEESAPGTHLAVPTMSLPGGRPRSCATRTVAGDDRTPGRQMAR
ncbi:MAG: hypothetical protein ACRDV8_09660 [Acidimicrobiales bacterium]